MTPIGNTVPEFWKGIREGKVGIGEITRFDTEEYKVKLAAQVRDFKAADRIDPKAAKRMEPFVQYAVAAAKEAFADAGLDMEKEDPVSYTHLIPTPPTRWESTFPNISISPPVWAV